MSRTLTTTLAWAGDGAAHLRGLMMRMADAAFAAPSLLPGWSRAHVLTHVARNADAMINLLDWARTGVPSPAYASREQRDHDIEVGARRDPSAIRDDVVHSSDRLAVAVRAMPQEAWQARVGGQGGRSFPASDIPWMRAREMWVHSVDLDVGASLADAPAPMLVAVLDDAATTIGASPQCPPLALVATDLDRRWTLGGAGAGSARNSTGESGGSELSAAVEHIPADDVRRVEVRGTAVELATWLLGRSAGRELRAGDGSRLPAPPRWM
ncbi:maleylpyruvate isomerase family mycothiol-dependent enzyme [Pseudonocardia lacus]|uniref:maleylpyruvate isomerase family mycothiol-dependent enzyme n=1 Tax=Pseudonocardia lacus TaxID=2835865 RepID=UPI0027E37704|nr:maleylpyruvate isomerase family mycothiol-dependent enzyme [Pseudonocardia lacus]